MKKWNPRGVLHFLCFPSPGLLCENSEKNFLLPACLYLRPQAEIQTASLSKYLLKVVLRLKTAQKQQKVCFLGLKKGNYRAWRPGLSGSLEPRKRENPETELLLVPGTTPRDGWATLGTSLPPLLGWGERRVGVRFP